ncbi:MAG: GNAT family N-acetyltransferase [Streptosporangiales bacterium]|nr:GNAT family N-acetyltransferase [Streptosporangiales bacterium]
MGAAGDAARVSAERIAEVRAFNRFYTAIIGLLDEGYLDSAHSLSEVRVLFELGRRPETEVVALRRDLGLDAGYLSRMLARLGSAGLVERTRSARDARRQLVRLTARGRAEQRELDRRSAAGIAELMGRLDDAEQERLVEAMGTIHGLLGEGRRSFRLRPATDADLDWVVRRHGSLYAEEYGWDSSFEELVGDIVKAYAADHDPDREGAWIAEADGVDGPVGCVFCVRADDRTAKLRLLLVDPAARGLGVGAALVDECLAFASKAGYERITLWTNDVLTSARRIYERAGFTLRDSEPHHSFGHSLTGQTWDRDL